MRAQIPLLPSQGGQVADEGLPTGARIARAGRDMTIVAYSAMVHEALAVAEELATEGTEIEVVDLRSIKPLDTDTVMASVARTGRLLCVGEAWPWGGVTAEVIARVASEGLACSTRRRNGSTRRTRRCLIIQTFGRAPSDRAKHVAIAARRKNRPMPQVPIIMPQLGESIAEATVTSR